MFCTRRLPYSTSELAGGVTLQVEVPARVRSRHESTRADRFPWLDSTLESTAMDPRLLADVDRCLQVVRTALDHLTYLDYTLYAMYGALYSISAGGAVPVGMPHPPIPMAPPPGAPTPRDPTESFVHKRRRSVSEDADAGPNRRKRSRGLEHNGQDHGRAEPPRDRGSPGMHRERGRLTRATPERRRE